MAQSYSFFGKTIYRPGVYSEILVVGAGQPVPDGNNALMIIAEAPNGPAFGEVVSGGNVNDYKIVLGDQGPAIEAVFRAFNASPAVTPAQDIRVINPRALVQAAETIYTTAPTTGPAIDVGSSIYGPIGNGVKLSLASSVASVKLPWLDDPISQTIDNPLFDITLAGGGLLIDDTKISVGLTGALVEFKFTEYGKLIDLLNAIEDTTGAVVVKDVNTSDNLSTIGLFDHVTVEADISTVTTVKGDLKQLFDFLDQGVDGIDASKLATATTMVDDFDITLTGGSSGVDPDAVQWGLVYDALEKQKIAVTCPIADGMATPYDETLTAAVMALDESHAVKMSGAQYKGKKRQSFISAHGGYGWSGQFVAKPLNTDAIVTLKKPHNSKYSLFFGDGLNAFNESGIEYAQLPCYFAVQAASMFLGGLASRVITQQPVTGIKASTIYDEADGKKLHDASIVIPETDEKGTRIRQLYTTWTQDTDPRNTVPSRIRCVVLSDNDIARKLEDRISQFQADGISPSTAEMITFIKRILDSHVNPSVNWVEEYGDVTFKLSGIKFDYEVIDLVVPEIPEIGFGQILTKNAS